MLWRYSLWQGALIGVNFFLAFRGVQIWQLIQRVKVIQILHRVGWVAPLTQRGGRLLHATTLPVRGLVRGLTSPGRAVAATLAHRRAEELEGRGEAVLEPLTAPNAVIYVRRSAGCFVVMYEREYWRSPL